MWGTQGYTHLPFCCPCRRPAQGFKGEAPSKPQILVLPPHATAGKQQRFHPFALPSSLLRSRKGSNTQARNGAQRCPKFLLSPVHCSQHLLLPMDHLVHGEPSCCCPEPPRVAQSQHASDKAHVQKCNSRKMYLANTSFHKQQQLGRQSPVLVTSPWKGSHDTGETFSRCPHLMAKV